MPPTSNSLLIYRYNTTQACDSCRSSKSRCKKVHLDQPKCNKCAERNIECIYSFQPQKRGPRHSANPQNNRNLPTSLPTPLSTFPLTSFPTPPTPSLTSPSTSPPTSPLTSFPTPFPTSPPTSPLTSFPTPFPTSPPTSPFTPPFTPLPTSSHRYPFTPLPSVFINYEEFCELIRDLSQEGIYPDVNVRESIQEENNILDNMFAKEQTAFDTLTSTSASPCPYKNAAGHYCHEGCILRYKNIRYT
ncbi:3461_t:CDS:1 [Cetraspora pellucida]|uniref:3461_t:CDS:1 n=1 Tax=Cetraspora pellucida TaxID=1433469 RepID=A0ACA9L9Z9_9GLOM|nr:3461_t:CDS:1 [Cetraspora pellucida]